MARVSPRLTEVTFDMARREWFVEVYRSVAPHFERVSVEGETEAYVLADHRFEEGWEVRRVAIMRRVRGRLKIIDQRERGRRLDEWQNRWR